MVIACVIISKIALAILKRNTVLDFFYIWGNYFNESRNYFSPYQKVKFLNKNLPCSFTVRMPIDVTQPPGLSLSTAVFFLLMVRPSIKASYFCITVEMMTEPIEYDEARGLVELRSDKSYTLAI